MKNRMIAVLCIVCAGLLNLATGESAHGQGPGSGSYLLVADWGGDMVLRYDGASGAFVDTFVPKHSGGLNQPTGVLFGPHDQHLYVAAGEYGGNGLIHAVVRYNGATGNFMDVFADEAQVPGPLWIIFGPDGNLYVGTRNYGLGGRVARYDGHTGVFLGDFVPAASGGLRAPGGLVFGPSCQNLSSLDLYVSSAITDAVLCYDGTTGAFVREFVAGGSGNLDAPQGLTFGPDGNLYVSSSGFDGGVSAVMRFQGPSGPFPGQFMDTFVPRGSGGLMDPIGVIFGPDGNADGHQDLYVANSDSRGNSPGAKKGTVKRYDGVTGAFIDTFVTARSGGLDDAGGLTFTETDPVTLEYLGE